MPIDILIPDLKQLHCLPHVQRKQLPSVSAVYFLIGADEVIRKLDGSVLYVGCTQDLRKRWRSHTMNSLAKSRTVSGDWMIAWLEAAADERNAIELACAIKWQPPYSHDYPQNEQAVLSDPRIDPLWRIRNAAEKLITYGD